MGMLYKSLIAAVCSLKWIYWLDLKEGQYLVCKEYQSRHQACNIFLDEIKELQRSCRVIDKKNMFFKK